MNGSDPSDAIRVVNALLTQLDQLRKKTNVIIMATSNLTECIDFAFLSRADIYITLMLIFAFSHFSKKKLNYDSPNYKYFNFISF